MHSGITFRHYDISMLLMALTKAHAPGKLDAGPGPIDMMDMEWIRMPFEIGRSAAKLAMPCSWYAECMKMHAHK